MKVLLVVPWEQEFGGVAFVVRNLARYLKSQGHEVLFLVPGRSVVPRQKITKFGLTGFEMRFQMPFGERHPLMSLLIFAALFPAILYHLIRLVRREKIQIVNIHYPVAAFFYFALCRRLLLFKLVTSFHGADVFPQTGCDCARDSLGVRLLLSASDLLISPCRRSRDDFIAIFPGLARKVHAIHNGADLAELPGTAPRSIGAGQEKRILCTAYYHSYKGLDVLIRSFSFLLGSDPALRLLLAGDGPERARLEDLAKSLGVHGQIDFLGWQGREQIKNLLHSCDIFVLPSRCECFSISILEALACGRPVVATRVGGTPEIIEHGKTGLLVEPDDPSALAEGLKLLLTDAALRATLAANGHDTVTRSFSWQNTGAAYADAFAGLLIAPSGMAPLKRRLLRFGR